MLHAMSESKAKTMTALHENVFTMRLLKLKSRDGINAKRFVELT